MLLKSFSIFETSYKMDSKYYTAYSYIPYIGKITDSSKASYLEVFRLGDGIKEHVRKTTKLICVADRFYQKYWFSQCR